MSSTDGSTSHIALYMTLLLRRHCAIENLGRGASKRGKNKTLCPSSKSLEVDELDELRFSILLELRQLHHQFLSLVLLLLPCLSPWISSLCTWKRYILRCGCHRHILWSRCWLHWNGGCGTGRCCLLRLDGRCGHRHLRWLACLRMQLLNPCWLDSSQSIEFISHA